MGQGQEGKNNSHELKGISVKKESERKGRSHETQFKKEKLNESVGRQRLVNKVTERR